MPERRRPLHADTNQSRHFAIVIDGPADATDDTLIWNN